LRIDITVHLVKPPAPTATRAVLTLGGKPMPAALTVDSVNQSLSLDYEDDKGDKTAAPAGASVVFASDTPASADVAAATPTATGFTAAITVGIIGAGNFSVVQTGAFEGDGVTPIPDPAPEPFTVVAGPANQAVLGSSAG
jgi:hypothetical protein